MALAFLFIVQCSQAPNPIPPKQSELSVWANEAIVSTYTYNYANYLSAEKEMAKYFSSAAWIAYTKALNDSKLLDTVKANAYTVSAVATSPPQIKVIAPGRWQASMPVLVLYQGLGKQQQQNLLVTITITSAPSGQGVRGLYIISLKSETTPSL